MQTAATVSAVQLLAGTAALAMTQTVAIPAIGVVTALLYVGPYTYLKRKHWVSPFVVHLMRSLLPLVSLPPTIILGVPFMHH